MKLYVKDPRNGRKVYLNIIARDRYHLAEKIGSYFFWIENEYFHVNDVNAEISGLGSVSGGAIAGAASGSIAGAAFGPGGAIIGGLIGTVIGNNLDKDKERVRNFNLS